MSSSIQSILFKEKQIEKDINIYQSKIDSKLETLKSKKEQEKKEFIIELEKIFNLNIQKAQEEMNEKSQAIVENMKKNSKKISYEKFLDSLHERINKEFQIKNDSTKGGASVK